MRRLASNRHGGAILEFTILAPVLFTVLLGIVEMGRMFYMRQGLEYATEEAARYYMLNPTTATSNVTTTLRNAMVGGVGARLTITYTDTTSCNGNASVTCTLITASYGYTPVAGFLNLTTTTLTAKAQAVRY